jgi:Arylsulfotransferase (ASST)
VAEIAYLSETTLEPCRVRRGGVWLRVGTVRKRACAALVAVMAMTGCGSKPQPATMSFESRPDLKPPVVTVVANEDGASEGDIFIAPKHDAPQKGPEILDANGQPVWFEPVAGPDQAADFRVQTYEGKPVLTWWEGPVASPILGTGYGHYVIADTSYKPIVRLEAGLGKNSGDLHEFQLTPRGTALVTLYKTVPGSLESIGGPKRAKIADSIVQEIDVKTGKVLFDWHSVGHVAIDESYVPLTGPGSPPPGNPYDYFHVNSVEEEPDGNFLISARNTSAVYELDRKSGDVLWRLGGKKSTFKMGPGTTFWWQHDARRRADGTITLYDDGAAPPREPQSRGIRLRLDMDAKTATLVQADLSPDRLLAGSQGNMQVLDNGHAVVGWGAVPRVTEYDGDGKIVFDAIFSEGDDSYRAYRFPWSARAPGRPAIATAKGRGGLKTIYASWNGATGVASWQVLAGDDRSSLQPVGEPQPVTGFETVLRANTNDDFIAVQALDAGGNALGQSAAVPISGGLSTG